MLNRNRRGMSTKAGVAVALGVAVVAGAAVYALTSGDSPIEVGDGSMNFDYAGGVDKKSDHQASAGKALHALKVLNVVDRASQATVQQIEIAHRNWTLTSNVTKQAQFSRDDTFLGSGVAGTCDSPAGWSGAANSFTCNPTDGPQLTPATLTFSDGNCPGTNSPSCPTIACPSGRCSLNFSYKK